MITLIDKLCLKYPKKVPGGISTYAKFKLLQQKIPLWTSLKALGENRIIKGSYLWFILVPIASKIFVALEEKLSFNIFGQIISINTNLPTIWWVFYLGALFFFIANVIYSVSVPIYISKYNGFDEHIKTKG